MNDLTFFKYFLTVSDTPWFLTCMKVFIILEKDLNTAKENSFSSITPPPAVMHAQLIHNNTYQVLALMSEQCAIKMDSHWF